MNAGGETIQLSFGPAANAVTSHLCNLQGLASTSTSTTSNRNGNNGGSVTVGNSDASPLCDPYVTHCVQKDMYVPRVLFVDGKNNFSPWPTADTLSSSLSSVAEAPTTNWDGKLEIHQRVPLFNQDNAAGAPSSLNSNNSNNNSNKNGNNDYSSSFVDTDITAYNVNQLNSVQRNALNKFQSMASSTSLSTNINSRYHSSKYQNVSSQFVYPDNGLATGYGGGGGNSDARVMTWDDEEEEEEEEEDEYYKERRLQLERQKWDQHEMEVQNGLNNAWDTFFSGVDKDVIGHANDSTKNGNANGNDDAIANANVKSNANANDTKEEVKTNENKSVLHHLQWLNYFMPPHPNSNMYSAPLPFDHLINTIGAGTIQSQAESQSKNHSIMYSHYCGKYTSSSSSSCNSMVDGITTQWRDDLSDKVRKWLEDCDALKGVQVMVDNDKSLFGGLATSVLEELHDECRSAGKLSILVHDGDEFEYSLSSSSSSSSTTNNQDGDKVDNSYWRSERKVVHSFRSQLNHGLNLHGVGEYSALVLPLSLTNCWNSLGRQSSDKTLFEASAVGALALEATTLPYRLLKQSSSSQSMGRKRSKIGIMSGYFQGSGQSDDNDAFPTADKLSYHEFISSLRPTNYHTVLELAASVNNNEMKNRLAQGTSIERRRMEEEMNRNRNSMYYRRSRGRDIDAGLWVEDCGPNGGIMSPLSPIGDKNTSRSMHTHFSLSTAFRPMKLTSVEDPVSTYTTMLMEGMGIRYRPQSSVGTVVRQSIDDLTMSQSYAAGAYWKSIFNGNIQNVPILTVAGNTTRSHSHLNTTAKNIALTLSRKYQGYHSRDSTMGIVPEREDCTDALEHCLKLRDTYEPPMMFDEEEGTYFEDNTD